MTGPANALVDYLGIGELSFHLEPPQRRALLIISALPALFFVATITQLAFEIEGAPFEPFSNTDWLRLHRLSMAVQGPAAYVGLAVMMIVGIGGMTRAEASWCFPGAIVVAGLALLFGAYGSLVYVLVDGRDFQAFRDWHPDRAVQFATLAGLVAAGYAFLAFRGLAPRAAE